MRDCPISKPINNFSCTWNFAYSRSLNTNKTPYSDAAFLSFVNLFFLSLNFFVQCVIVVFEISHHLLLWQAWGHWLMKQALLTENKHSKTYRCCNSINKRWNTSFSHFCFILVHTLLILIQYLNLNNWIMTNSKETKKILSAS